MPMSSRSPASPRPIALTAIALSACAVAASIGLSRATALREGWPAEADALYLPSAPVLKALSLGHGELAADLVAVRANVYFGSQIAAKAPQQNLSRYVETAVDLDPRFHRLYLSGASMLIYNGRPITVEAIQSATALLKRGRRAFPEDWELAFQAGFNQFFELPKLAGENDPRVPDWRQDGIEQLREATLLEGAPTWLPNLVARLLTKRGSEELAVKHLEQAYAVTSSEETRREIRLKLMQLRGEQMAERMEEEKRRLEAFIEGAYPYAPEAFSIVTGPRLPRWVDPSGGAAR
jgi:hypothetical protein